MGGSARPPRGIAEITWNMTENYKAAADNGIDLGFVGRKLDRLNGERKKVEADPLGYLFGRR